MMGKVKYVGILPAEDALQLMTCGPSGRASGVPKDVRQDQAYSAYADLGVKAITQDIVTAPWSVMSMTG